MSSPTEPESPPLSADSIAKSASELNNLLQIISGTGALIEKGVEEGEGPEKYLAMLRESIERAEKVSAELAQEAGGAGEKMLVHPDLAPFLRSRKRPNSTTNKHSILLVDDEKMALT